MFPFIFRKKPANTTPEKVYCVYCRFYKLRDNSTLRCIIGTKDTPIQRENIYGDCTVRNANNDCKDFKEWRPCSCYPFRP